MRSIKLQVVALLALFVIVIFISCDSSITNENSSDIKSASSKIANGLIQTPVVEHTIGNFNPLLKWDPLTGAEKYKIQREKCCTTFANFTVFDPDTSFQDGGIIHPDLEAVGTAVPDKWIRYRVKAIYENDDESGWTPWKYYTVPDETYW